MIGIAQRFLRAAEPGGRHGSPCSLRPMTGLEIPTFADVLAARRRIAPYLRPTPLYRYEGLDHLAGTEVWIKHENHQPVGAFKVRGGVNLVGQLSEDDRRGG